MKTSSVLRPAASLNLARKKTVLETNGHLFRIRKGPFKGEWKPPSEVAFLSDGERTYFAFMAPMGFLFPSLKANTVYFSTECKTEERMIEEEAATI